MKVKITKIEMHRWIITRESGDQTVDLPDDLIERYRNAHKELQAVDDEFKRYIYVPMGMP